MELCVLRTSTRYCLYATISRLEQHSSAHLKSILHVQMTKPQNTAEVRLKRLNKLSAAPAVVSGFFQPLYSRFQTTMSCM
eukprot:519335-Pelagomonas_calceolata.AAC.1